MALPISRRANQIEFLSSSTTTTTTVGGRSFREISGNWVMFAKMASSLSIFLGNATSPFLAAFSFSRLPPRYVPLCPPRFAFYLLVINSLFCPRETIVRWDESNEWDIEGSHVDRLNDHELRLVDNVYYVRWRKVITKRQIASLWYLLLFCNAICATGRGYRVKVSILKMYRIPA